MKIDYQFGITTHPLKEYDLKKAHTKKLARLLDLEESALIIKIGQHYLRNFIPAPIENEDEYWMCSCFPSNHNIPLRFNIFWHEVLNIHEDEGTTKKSSKWRVLLFTDKDYLTSGLIRQLQSKIKGLKFDPEYWYETGLQSQLAVKLPINSYFDLVADENVYESIRQYNYQLSCKGRKVHKGHNYELARMLLKNK